MYEPTAHALLNRILDRLEPELQGQARRELLTRLGANFYGLHSLFSRLYGRRADFEERLGDLVEVLVRRYGERSPADRVEDRRREADPDWFLSERWVAMALYTDGFAGDLPGLTERLPYLQELGVDIVHIMPILRCPPRASDGGYAVSDYRDLDPGWAPWRTWPTCRRRCGSARCCWCSTSW